MPPTFALDPFNPKLLVGQDGARTSSNAPSLVMQTKLPSSPGVFEQLWLHVGGSRHAQVAFETYVSYTPPTATASGAHAGNATPAS